MAKELTKEQEKLQSIIDMYKSVIAKADEVKAVIKRFDGKMYNVRVDRALREIGCYISKRYGTKDIIYVKTGIVHYGENREMICSYDIFENRRTNAAIINAAIDDRVSELKKRVLQLENELSFGEGLVEYLTNQIAEMEKMLKGLSYDFVEAYGSKRICFNGHNLVKTW